MRQQLSILWFNWSKQKREKEKILKFLFSIFMESWGRPKEGLILVGKDVEPRIGLLVNHAFAEKGVGIITWLSFGSDVGNVE